MKVTQGRTCSDIQLSPFARVLWAKAGSTPKSLWHHMLDSGHCASVVAEDARFQSSIEAIADWMELTVPQAKRLVAYLAANHDGYGKAAPGFQKKDPMQVKPFLSEGMISVRDGSTHFRHEIYGARRYKSEAETFSIPSVPARIFASTVKLHHQGKIGDAPDPIKSRETWERLGNELHSAIIRVFASPLEELKNDCKHCDAAVMTLLALVILADWLASSEPFSELDDTLPDEAYVAASREMARRVVEADGLQSKAYFPPVSDYQQLWPALSSKALRPVQRTVLQCADPSAGLTIIEAPMGEGKTEAGAFQAARLCSLWKKQGIYFALPTAATSNQMYGRIEEMLSTLGMGGARLMHGMAWLVERQTQLPQNADEDDRAAAYDWLRPLRRAMLAESAVGTVDQAMLAVMPVKYGCLRLLGLTGKVLVIDEIHAYDAYMGGIIERLLEWCRALRIPVILLSATLTAEKRGRLVEAYGGHLDEIDEHYPLITQVSKGQARQIPVDGCTMEGCFHFLPLALWQDVHSIACRAVERVAHGGCLCVLMNTVAQAQKVWQEARKLADPDTMVLLFHARFKAKERDEIERRCVRLFGKHPAQRPKKAILVCTQIVEQSLDVDFDGMITQIAPIDLLLQRAGRVHRHERGKRPEGMEDAVIEVLVPTGDEFDDSGRIYAPWLLERTRQLLPQTVHIPQDVRRVIETVYAQPDTEQIPDAWAKLMFSDALKRAQAGGNMLPKPNPERFFGWDMPSERFSMEEPDEGTTARTRLGDCSVRVALLPETEIRRILADPQDADLARTAFENSFTVRESTPKKLDTGVYEGSKRTKRLLLVSEESLPVQIGRTKLDYDEARGALTERMRGE